MLLSNYLGWLVCSLVEWLLLLLHYLVVRIDR